MDGSSFDVKSKVKLFKISNPIWFPRQIAQSHPIQNEFASIFMHLEFPLVGLIGASAIEDRNILTRSVSESNTISSIVVSFRVSCSTCEFHHMLAASNHVDLLELKFYTTYFHHLFGMNQNVYTCVFQWFDAVAFAMNGNHTPLHLWERKETQHTINMDILDTILLYLNI